MLGRDVLAGDLLFPRTNELASSLQFGEKLVTNTVMAMINKVTQASGIVPCNTAGEPLGSLHPTVFGVGEHKIASSLARIDGRWMSLSGGVDGGKVKMSTQSSNIFLRNLQSTKVTIRTTSTHSVRIRECSTITSRIFLISHESCNACRTCCRNACYSSNRATLLIDCWSQQR